MQDLIPGMCSLDVDTLNNGLRALGLDGIPGHLNGPPQRTVATDLPEWTSAYDSVRLSVATVPRPVTPAKTPPLRRHSPQACTTRYDSAPPSPQSILQACTTRSLHGERVRLRPTDATAPRPVPPAPFMAVWGL